MTKSSLNFLGSYHSHKILFGISTLFSTLFLFWLNSLVLKICVFLLLLLFLFWFFFWLHVVTACPSTYVKNPYSKKTDQREIFLHEYRFLTAKLNLHTTNEEGTKVKCSTRRAMGSNLTMRALAQRGGFDSIEECILQGAQWGGLDGRAVMSVLLSRA